LKIGISHSPELVREPIDLDAYKDRMKPPKEAKLPSLLYHITAFGFDEAVIHQELWKEPIDIEKKLSRSYFGLRHLTNFLSTELFVTELKI
jgi:hypothetical protein